MPVMLKFLVAMVVVGAVSVWMTARAPESGLAGSWSTEDYRMAEGARHPVRGTLFFSEKDWMVLFFVLDDKGRPVRGSAEGGVYERSGDSLVFRHNHHLSGGSALEGLAESPLRMEIRNASEATREECRIELVQDRLVIHFPSGNSMTFQRR